MSSKHVSRLLAWQLVSRDKCVSVPLCLTLSELVGPPSTPYADGLFKLSIDIPKNYPFDPPAVTFTTPVYHPNVDAAGNICLDVLKGPPNGAWRPCLNIASVLQSISLLLGSPNPDDPLVPEIVSSEMVCGDVSGSVLS